MKFQHRQRGQADSQKLSASRQPPITGHGAQEQKQMFTLKLYKNGPLPPSGRTIVMEVAGIWIDHCDNGVLHVQPFAKTVGMQDETPLPDFYVGGNGPPAPSPDGAIHEWNYCGWGVLENAQGKTTEMLR